MSTSTRYYLMGLDAGGMWRRVGMWTEEGRAIWPISDKDKAMQEAADFKITIVDGGWQDAVLEEVTSKRLPIEAPSNS